MNAPPRMMCGVRDSVKTHSPKGDMHVDICSACHPFYTGKQNIVDTAGRVERFRRKYGENYAETKPNPKPKPAKAAEKPAPKPKAEEPKAAAKKAEKPAPEPKAEEPKAEEPKPAAAPAENPDKGGENA